MKNINKIFYCCWECFKAIASVGIKRIVYKDEYRNNPLVEDHAKLLGIKIEKFVEQTNS